MTSIVGFGMTRFGKREEDLVSLAVDSSRDIASRYSDSIDLVIVSNSYGGEYTGLSGLSDHVCSALSIEGTPSMRIDNTSGSGGSAIYTANSLIESGDFNTVLIVGAEKMTSVPSRRSTSIIASLLSERERKSGLTLPSLAAFMAKIYTREYGVGMESISSVAVKNHRNGAMNPYAHFQKPVELSEIMRSKMIADPLRIYDFCPVSDGAASLILTRDDMVQSFTGKAVKISSIASSSSNPVISERKSFLEIDCVKGASDKVFKESGLERKDVDFAELHDMSTILEIVESENIGFFERGSGHRALLDGYTEISGGLPINPSGGLNSKGHPIGATGIAQACEIFQQINGLAGARQVKKHDVGFTLNMAGFGNNAVAAIYEAFP